MKKLFLLTIILLAAAVYGMGYEFKVSSLTTPVGKSAPKQVLVRKKPAAVVFLKTKIANLKDMRDSTIEQGRTSDGYVLYIAPDWPANLWLTAPGFAAKLVDIGSLSSGSVRELTVSVVGKDPKGMDVSAAQVSFAADPSNATAAVTEPYTPEIWVNTDASFAQIRPLLKEGGYTILGNATAPYRISPKKKKAKAGDVLSSMALNKLGGIGKMVLEDRTVYNLDVKW